ncbi:DUF397 domain-containing protein [Streptomyces rubellomurinus]|uniref:DUF397 domain-containing protein n=1 Tax=Streptomyces rubellomurinus (strain ATCC 31215) TaxID=359131 RepID=UPI00099CDB78|nr:DUF397 domain-containing protein [Streptomyces rubellomurinus]
MHRAQLHGRVVSSGMAVQNSKNPSGPAPTFPSDAWTAFVTAVKTDELPGA